MEYPSELLYTKEHEWVRREADEVVVGITDYAQQALGDIVFVELPREGDALEQMKPFGVVEAVKTVSDLFSPIGGKITAVNAALADNPGLVNTSPYGEGWMIRAEAAEGTSWDDLLSAEAYETLVKELEGETA